MNKMFKLTMLCALCGTMLLGFQTRADAGEKRVRKSSLSFNFNLGLGSFGSRCCERDSFDSYGYERTIIREYRPRVRERVIVYPSYPSCYEEVIVSQPRYHERVVVYPSYY